MALIVGVHGVANFKHFKRGSHCLETATETIGADWTGWTREGLSRLSPPVEGPEHLPVAYYSDCLHRGTPLGLPDDPDLQEPFAQELFLAWVDELIRARGGSAQPVPQGRATRLLLRQPAQWLTEHYGETARRVVTLLCAELATYFGVEHADRREAARQRVLSAIAQHQPRVVLAHSLGSVVAYEALCAAPEVKVDLLVTLGSPLGMAGVVFHRLQPRPHRRGIRPPGVAQWVNISDAGDPVAVPAGRLADRFEGVEDDLEASIHHVDPHSVSHYLRCSPLTRVLAPYVRAWRESS